MSVVAAACGSDDDSESDPAAPSETAESGGPGPSESAESSGAASDTPCSPDDAHKIAIVGHYSGAAGTLHSSAYAGVEAFMAQLNADGGIDGRCVEVVKRDGTDNTERLTSLVKEQAEDGGVVAVVGLGTNADQVSLIPEVNRLELPTILTPSATLSEDPGEWVFGIGLDLGRAIAPAIVRFVLTETPAARIATFALDAPSTRGGAEAVGRAIEERGGAVVASEFVTREQADMRAVADSLISGEPDWIIITGAAPAQIQSLVNSLKVSSRPDQRVIAIGGAGTDQLALAESANYYGTSPTVQATAEIRAAVESIGGGADALTAEDTVVTMGWVVGLVLEEALSSCADPCTRAALRDALEVIDDFDVGGLTEPVSLVSHQGLRAVAIFSWDPQSSSPNQVGDWIPAYDEG